MTDAARSLLNSLDEIHRKDRPYNPQLDARIESYSLAARMQLSASEALDLSQESQHTLKAYGVGEQETDSYGRHCLLARRLVERGVRFVQIFLEEQPWDSHVDLGPNHQAICRKTDLPVAGCCVTSNNADYWIRHSSSGAENLAGHQHRRSQGTSTPAVTTTCRRFPRGWPVAV